MKKRGELRCRNVGGGEAKERSFRHLQGVVSHLHGILSTEAYFKVICFHRLHRLRVCTAGPS